MFHWPVLRIHITPYIIRVTKVKEEVVITTSWANDGIINIENYTESPK
jgi:hypothetical protein